MPDERGAYHILFYEEDLEIAKSLELDVFRTGVEWSLVEPREGYFDRRAVELFRDYLASIKRRGLSAWVTFHHFTNPRWVWKYGGWESKIVVDRFVQYVDLIARELGDLIDVALLVNEPNMYAFLAYVRGDIPPYGFLSLKHYAKVLSNMDEAIMRARDVAKSYNLRTSFTYSYTYFSTNNIFLKPIIRIINKTNNKYIKLFKEMDYTAINFYVVGRYENFALRFEIRPEALLKLKPPTPLAITEFGIATRDEQLRTQYARAMACVFDKIKPVVAIWWSFLHGYEWGLGYEPFFALVDVMGTTRVVTPFARRFRKILREPGSCKFTLDLGLEWRWSPHD